MGKHAANEPRGGGQKKSKTMAASTSESAVLDDRRPDRLTAPIVCGAKTAANTPSKSTEAKTASTSGYNDKSSSQAHDYYGYGPWDNYRGYADKEPEQSYNAYGSRYTDRWGSQYNDKSSSQAHDDCGYGSWDNYRGYGSRYTDRWGSRCHSAAPIAAAPIASGAKSSTNMTSMSTTIPTAGYTDTEAATPKKQRPHLVKKHTKTKKTLVRDGCCPVDSDTDSSDTETATAKPKSKRLPKPLKKHTCEPAVPASIHGGNDLTTSMSTGSKSKHDLVLELKHILTEIDILRTKSEEQECSLLPSPELGQQH